MCVCVCMYVCVYGQYGDSNYFNLVRQVSRFTCHCQRVKYVVHFVSHASQPTAIHVAPACVFSVPGFKGGKNSYHKTRDTAEMTLYFAPGPSSRCISFSASRRWLLVVMHDSYFANIWLKFKPTQRGKDEVEAREIKFIISFAASCKAAVVKNSK